MANSPSHLVCLFVVTSGQNGESLGCDEEPIVVLAYALHDISNNKVSDEPETGWRNNITHLCRCGEGPTENRYDRMK